MHLPYVLVETEGPFTTLTTVRTSETWLTITIVLDVLNNTTLGREALGALGALEVLGHVADR